MKFSAKIAFLILITISLVNCKTNNNRLHKDPLIREVFNDDEINTLQEIVDYYDNYMIIKTKNHNIDSAYHQYNQNLYELDTSLRPWDIIGMDSDSIKFFINSIQRNQGFKSIWRKEFVKDGEDTTNYFLALNCEGPYMIFLKRMVVKDSAFFYYEESINSMGCGYIVPTLVSGFIYYHNRRDFSDVKERLFAAIHYLTLGTYLNKKQHTTNAHRPARGS